MKMNENYRKTLVSTLEQLYHLSKEEAIEVVENSSVNKMFQTESSARWQMHQPLRVTVAEIYDEYEGSMISA